MMRSLSPGKKADFALLARLRTVGPYEEWLLRRDSGTLMVARRPRPDRPDQDALNQRLSAGSRLAKRVEHQNVVHCMGRIQAPGLTAQLLETLDGVALATALEKARAPSPALAVWIGRQMAEGVAHAHSLKEAHKNLSPEHVMLLRPGNVKVDFGLSGSTASSNDSLTSLVDTRYSDPRWLLDPSDHPKQDAFSIGAIVWEMLAGQRFSEARARAGARYVRVPMGRPIARLEAILEQCLNDRGDGVADARVLADGLTRVFYADLNGEDDRDGSKALAQWIGPHLKTTTASTDDEEMPMRPPDVTDTFDRLLVQRDEPIHPAELTQADASVGVSDAWTPGLALRTQAEFFSAARSRRSAHRPRPVLRNALFWYWIGFSLTFAFLLLLAAMRR